MPTRRPTKGGKQPRACFAHLTPPASNGVKRHGVSDDDSGSGSDEDESDGDSDASLDEGNNVVGTNAIDSHTVSPGLGAGDGDSRIIDFITDLASRLDLTGPQTSEAVDLAITVSSKRILHASTKMSLLLVSFAYYGLHIMCLEQMCVIILHDLYVITGHQSSARHQEADRYPLLLYDGCLE